MRALQQVIAPVPDHEELDRLIGGELVATSAPRGRRVTVSFRGAYELLLTIDGQVVERRPRQADRRALISIVRRVPALYAALEQSFSLVLDELRPGRFAATDLYHRVEGCYLAHGELLNRIGRLELLPAPFAAVAPPRSTAELARTLDGLRALGDQLELRREEDGVVIARARFDRRAHGARTR